VLVPTISFSAKYLFVAPNQLPVLVPQAIVPALLESYQVNRVSQIVLDEDNAQGK
jgi:hypothetical protein